MKEKARRLLKVAEIYERRRGRTDLEYNFTNERNEIMPTAT